MLINVRDYCSNDLNSINELLMESFSVSKKEIIGSEFHEIVAEVESDIAGYLLLTKVFNPILNSYYCLVDYVCVSSKYRRLGVGRKMLEYAYKIAKEENTIYMQLTCSTFRVAAHKLYESCGFLKRESDIFRKEII